MKTIIIVLVVLGIGVTAYYLRNNGHKSGPAAGSLSRPTTAEVIQTNISFAVNAAGEIGPAEQVSVRPEINGKIDKLPVDIGDQVKKGDLLFRKLDDKELQQERESNLTAIERAKLELQRRSVISNARSNCSPSVSSPRII
jgi:multidrug efflux pump subunit AcrA (membrane-fusion protein)